MAENNPNWKGGFGSEDYRLRRTTEYKEWRLKVYERDDYTCQKCLYKGNYLNAHHIKSFKNYPSLRHDLSNGTLLNYPLMILLIHFRPSTVVSPLP